MRAKEGQKFRVWFVKGFGVHGVGRAAGVLRRIDRLDSVIDRVSTVLRQQAISGSSLSGLSAVSGSFQLAALSCDVGRFTLFLASCLKVEVSGLS